MIGQSEDDLQIPAEMLQQQAEVVAIGISSALREELLVIASDPRRNVFRASNFQGLERLKLQVSTAVCFASGYFLDVIFT